MTNPQEPRVTTTNVSPQSDLAVAAQIAPFVLLDLRRLAVRRQS